MSNKFQVGRIYQTRSICDYDCVYSYKVIKRTAKTLTLLTEDNKTVVRRIYLYEGEESCKPEGSFSMCPIIRANKVI